MEHIRYVASLLRRNPFVPVDPTDPSAEADFQDVQSGIALPRAHCAFKGCSYVNDSKDCWEDNLKLHVKFKHLSAMQLPERDKKDYYDFYEAAIQERAQTMMPSVGVSIDRRSHRYVNDTFNDQTVFSLVCLVCAQMKTHTGLRSSRQDDGAYKKLTDIQYRK